MQVKGAQQQEEDVSYAHIQFKARGGQDRYTCIIIIIISVIVVIIIKGIRDNESL